MIHKQFAANISGFACWSRCEISTSWVWQFTSNKCSFVRFYKFCSQKLPCWDNYW